MKIATLKFALALGIALSVSFVLCNILFAIAGNDFGLNIMNTLFHNMDFKPLMINESYNIVKLVCGMLVLFIEGFFTGLVTASIYNALIKNHQWK